MSIKPDLSHTVHSKKNGDLRNLCMIGAGVMGVAAYSLFESGSAGSDAYWATFCAIAAAAIALSIQVEWKNGK